MSAEPVRSAQISSCSMAAARNVSAAHNSTERSSLRNRCASLPMVVVFPDPFTPTTRMTAGGSATRAGARSLASRISSRWVRIIPFSSAASFTWWRSTRERMRVRISSVVRTPISAEMSVDSSSSSRSALISFFPSRASSIAVTNPARVFRTPLFNFSRRDGSRSTFPNKVWIILHPS